jgi:phage gpG-like protein
MKIKLTTPQQVSENIRKTIDLADNYKAFFTMIVGQPQDKRPWTIRGSIFKAFMTSTDPVDGSTWQPLKETYLKRKVALWGNTPTLIASGTLFRSLMGGSGVVNIVTGSKLKYGTTVPYAGFHMTGTRFMPRRRFMGFKKGDKTIEKLYVQYVKDMFGKGFKK